MRNVTVILDPYYGDRIHTAAFAGPVWICASPVNNAAFRPSTAPPAHVTTFQMRDLADRSDNLVALLPTLQDHHGELEDDAYCFPKGFVLHAIGIALSEHLVAALEDFGFSTFTSTSGGFEARV